MTTVTGLLARGFLGFFGDRLNYDGFRQYCFYWGHRCGCLMYKNRCCRLGHRECQVGTAESSGHLAKLASIEKGSAYQFPCHSMLAMSLWSPHSNWSRNIIKPPLLKWLWSTLRFWMVWIKQNEQVLCITLRDPACDLLCSGDSDQGQVICGIGRGPCFACPSVSRFTCPLRAIHIHCWSNLREDIKV